MFNGCIAFARIDGQVVVVQVVQSNRTSSHIEVIRFAYFGETTFLRNFTSSLPSRISTSDVLQFLPSSVTPTGETLTFSHDLFKQYIDLSTANQTELEAKWQRAMASGRVAALSGR